MLLTQNQELTIKNRKESLLNQRHLIRKGVVIFFLTFAWGFFAHGIMFSNKISFHDDAGNVGLGATYSSGRWLLEFILRGQMKLFGNVNFSLPFFSGIISLLFIAVAAYLIIDTLEIDNLFTWIAITGIMATFPAITGLFGYMFTAPAYMFGMCLAVLGAYVMCRRMHWINLCIGAFLIACSIGIYQAYMPLAVSIFVLSFFHNVLHSNTMTWKIYFQKILYFISACVLFLAIYLLLNKASLIYFNGQLSDYQGINTLGSTSLKGYCLRILIAYKEFFFPTQGVSRNMYPFTIDRFYQIMILAIGILLFILAIREWRNNKVKLVRACLLIIAFPLAANLIYIMCDSQAQPGIHSLMMYAQVAPFILFAYLIEKCILRSDYKKETLKKALATILFSLIIFISVSYVRLANICYLKADYMQTQAIGYFNRLIERIETTEGYNREYTILYVNANEKVGPEAPIEFSEIKIVPYGGGNIVNSHTWPVFMKVWCGFHNYYTYDESILESEIIEAMPSYPAEGSIKVVEDIVVVKF